MLLKKLIPQFIKDLKVKYEYRPINNLYKTNYDKKAILSYITDPFRTHSLNHTNHFEVKMWAKILHELGFQVDIIQFNLLPSSLNLDKYNLICGFGDIFQNYFENTNCSAQTIYYGAGMHVCHQNYASLQRVKDVYIKKNVWLAKSSRFVEKTWSHQTTLVDGIIALGNEICSDSYKKYYDGKVLSQPALFYKTQDIKVIMKNRREESRKHFLWFGSSGSIHKGLDLLLEYFSKNKNITLHICGTVSNEPEFVEIYKKELYETENIITYGFIDIKSKKFTNILSSCSFVVYPSCSEGGSPSALTVIGNGGLIPIISKETTISTGNEIWIDSLNDAGINKAIKKALSLKYEEIIYLQNKNYNYVNLNHSQKSYYKQLKINIKNILG
ncbi:MAG: hypothetical protein GQ570_01475 [Helicobacteraceae bacterium]|nr:hypothetical protein [Helicobacteraceae bacterium]